MSAQQKMKAGLVSLILDQPFYGALAMSLPLKADPSCKTAWVDGRNIGYNPAYIDSLTHDEITAILGHEVSHVALGHPWRRDGRSIKNWNISCDKAINHDLREAGFKLPQGVVYAEGDEVGNSAEWIFARMGEDDQPQPQPQDEDGDGPNNAPGPNPNGPGAGDEEDEDGEPQDGEGGDDPLGEVRDAPTTEGEDGEPAPTEGDWKQKTAAAAQMAKAMGKMPGDAARSVAEALKPRIDIRSLLLKFFSERSTGDFSWSRPNPRYIASGLYLPCMESKALGEVAILCDTSGSVDEVSLSYARGIVEDVIEQCSPASVSVYYVDAKVCRVDRFEKGEPLEWNPAGGGGTDFTSFFEDVESGEENPVCVVGISDLYATFPESIPAVPVLWLSTTAQVAPFGETVPLDQ